MGEHAAVYGRPALVAAVNRRVRVRLELADKSDGVLFDAPQLKVHERWTCGELRGYARRRRGAWQNWKDGGAGPDFGSTLDPRPSQLIAVAVGEALCLAGDGASFGGRLHVTSELPVGAGFGSSAAAASSIVLAVLEAVRRPPSQDELEALTLDVERRQHGTPSGIDGAAVVRGGVLWTTRRAGELSVEPIAVKRAGFFAGWRVAHTGPAAESTGEVVAAVRRRRSEDAESFDRALDLAAEATLTVRRLSEAEGQGDGPSLIDPIRRFSAWLASIGVVPSAVAQAVGRVEAAGGAAKISGAGCLAGPGAGSFLVSHPAPAAAARLLQSLAPFEPMDLRLGAPGARLETPDT
ncbi:MAG: hypothetical protein AAGM22_33315 [Acidobacteriota bacterium]